MCHRPDYAVHESSDEEDVEFGIARKKALSAVPMSLETEIEVEDRRLKRLQERLKEDEDDDEKEVDRCFIFILRLRALLCN